MKFAPFFCQVKSWNPDGWSSDRDDQIHKFISTFQENLVMFGVGFLQASTSQSRRTYEYIDIYLCSKRMETLNDLTSFFLDLWSLRKEVLSRQTPMVIGVLSFRRWMAFSAAWVYHWQDTHRVWLSKSVFGLNVAFMYMFMITYTYSYYIYIDIDVPIPY